MTRKDTKIAVFSGFIGIIFTTVYDLIKSKPVLSTFWNGLKWIWINVFEFELTVWQILLGLGILILIFYTLSLINNNEETIKNRNPWLSYERDKIHNLNWSWDWEKDTRDGKWTITDLRPICDSCGTKMHFSNSSWSSEYAECPRCELKCYEQKDIRKIEAVIIDNIKRGIYPQK